MRLRGKIIAAYRIAPQQPVPAGGIIMRTALAMSVAAVAIGLGTTLLSAGPGGIGAAPNATPPIQLAQSNYYGSYTTGWGWGYGFNFTPGFPAPYSFYYLP